MSAVGDARKRITEAATPDAGTDFDSLADWLGAMPESRNSFDITDEATTYITIAVEDLAERIVTRLAGESA